MRRRKLLQPLQGTPEGIEKGCIIFRYASISWIHVGESVSDFLRFGRILGISSEYVQGMFRVGSECVQSVFRVCSECVYIMIVVKIVVIA